MFDEENPKMIVDGVTYDESLARCFEDGMSLIEAFTKCRDIGYCVDEVSMHMAKHSLADEHYIFVMCRNCGELVETKTVQTRKVACGSCNHLPEAGHDWMIRYFKKRDGEPIYVGSDLISDMLSAIRDRDIFGAGGFYGYEGAGGKHSEEMIRNELGFSEEKFRKLMEGYVPPQPRSF